jgi:hypothetical protein
MNRIQFFVLTGLSIVVTLLLLTHIGLAYEVNKVQAQVARDQQDLNLGSAAKTETNQIAARIWQDSQRTNDPGLKDLLARQQITYQPPAGTNATETPAAPAH